MVKRDQFDTDSVFLGNLNGLALGVLHIDARFFDCDDDDPVMLLLHQASRLECLYSLRRVVEANTVAESLVLVISAVSEILNHHDWQ